MTSPSGLGTASTTLGVLGAAFSARRATKCPARKYDSSASAASAGGAARGANIAHATGKTQKIASLSTTCTASSGRPRVSATIPPNVTRTPFITSSARRMNTPSGAAATTAETSKNVVPAFPEWKASLRARRVSASSLANAGGTAAHASAATSAA